VELSHDDIGDISLALRHRIVHVEKQLAGELDAEDREEHTDELARLKALVKRVDAERPAAQQRFLERET
jgi:ABC-type phosphate transport system auxiliary subunit